MNGSSYVANDGYSIISSSPPNNLSNVSNSYLITNDLTGISSSTSNADLLKCGSCSTEFFLSDIVMFIQHKTKSCKQFHQITRARDKENHLRCNLCSESFCSAYNLLEHVQYSHKIELFKEISANTNSSSFHNTTNFSNNSSLPSKSIRNKTVTGNFQKTTQLKPLNNNISNHNNNSSGNSNNTSGNNLGLNLSKSNTSKNEIFIDVIPSDPTIDFSDKNQSYNITVSSNSSSNSSSSNKFTHSQSLDKHKLNQNNEIFTKISETTVESSQDISSNINIGEDNENSLSSSNDSQNKDLMIDTSESQIIIKSENNVPSTDDINNNSTKTNNNKNNNNNFKGENNGMSKRKKAPNKQGSSFSCDVCKASFNQKIHLTKHSAKHTGIKPFKCTECNYSTVERSHLKVHVRVHTGEKPFKCTFCEYATAQSSTLKIHKKRHHDNLDESQYKSKHYEALSATISGLLCQDQSKTQNNISTSPILPPIFCMLPSTATIQEEQNIVTNQNTELNDNNDTSIKKDSTKTNDNVNFDIYKDQKNLPPMKRFKIFHHLNSKHSSSEPENVSLKLQSSNDSNNDNVKTKINSNNISSNSNSSLSDNSTDNNNNGKKQENNDNKLLGLANIALERETN